MDSSEVLSMFLQICEGVKAFHEAKPEPLAHRDLKTANILVSDDRSPVIMDLGLCKVVSKMYVNYKFCFLNSFKEGMQ
jgi:serine/threonine protein kinase